MDSSAIPADADGTLAATLAEGIKDNLPIVFSYVPVAFAFEMNATKLCFTPPRSIIFPPLLSALAYGIAWKLLADV